MFYFCEDDPIINKTCIEFENAMKNENVIITSTNYGAHLCSYEHFFKIEQWITKPTFTFFDYFRKNQQDWPRKHIEEGESDSPNDELHEMTYEGQQKLKGQLNDLDDDDRLETQS